MPVLLIKLTREQLSNSGIIVDIFIVVVEGTIFIFTIAWRRAAVNNAVNSAAIPLDKIVNSKLQA
jgi:hypothetical protein